MDIHVYNILIVDDSRSILALLEDMILTNVPDVRVFTCKNSMDALEYLKENRVNLIMLDIHMPVMDGFEFAKIIKSDSKTKMIPIIFITASSNTQEFAKKGFALGAIDYVQKPFDETLLANKINTYVKLFKKEDELQSAYNVIHNILSHVDNMICIINKEEILLANKRFLNFFGFEDEKSLKSKHKNICDFFVLEEKNITNDMCNQNLIDYLLSSQTVDTKISLYDEAKFEEKIFIIKISAMNTENQEAQEYIISLTDISETERLKKSYQLQAIIDPLTQIYNRQAFNDKYPKEFYAAKTKKKNLSMIMADIDHFKQINDVFGHHIGDYVLKEFCKIINKTIPNSYFFARWGGEEFIIIAKEDALDIVITNANQARKTIEAYEFLHVKKITCSFGITQLVESDDENSLLNRLDKALYSAKLNGRNRVEVL